MERVLVSCVPLADRGGVVPTGLRLRRCQIPGCSRKIVVTKESLAMGNITLACNICAAKIVMEQTQLGVPTEIARAPGSLGPNSAVTKNLASGEMTRNPDDGFEELPIISPELLARLNAKSK